MLFKRKNARTSSSIFFERNGRKAPEKSAFLITDKHLTERPTKDKRNTTWSCKSAKKTLGLEAERD
jgi:hypothetical protein